MSEGGPRWKSSSEMEKHDERQQPRLWWVLHGLTTAGAAKSMPPNSPSYNLSFRVVTFIIQKLRLN
eukprot:283431-Rhodomonas_salina.1